jgi:uncharacterized protein (TIGR03083 family)
LHDRGVSTDGDDPNKRSEKPVNDDAFLQPMVASEYLALAEVLERASEADWDTPSLCQGWRVREVVAHMTMPVRYDNDAFMKELSARDFDFTRLSNDVAARDAELPTDELLSNLRSDLLLSWEPPGGGLRGALNHSVIHGLDIGVPLAIARPQPDKAVRVVLDDLTVGGVHVHFGTIIDGRTLEATDSDWSYGSGPVLRGTEADLALMICGRTLPSGRVEGDPL